MHYATERMHSTTGKLALKHRAVCSMRSEYTPKYALYQKTLREKQIERAQKMLDSGSAKRNRKNPTDPARFIGKIAASKQLQGVQRFFLFQTVKDGIIIYFYMKFK